MAFLSWWKQGDPLSDREQARRRGMRDARQGPLGEFTDPGSQPSFVAEVLAQVREEIAAIDKRLSAGQLALLARLDEAKASILGELDRFDLRPGPYTNGHSARETGEFISIAESRRRRAEALRLREVEAARRRVREALALAERCAQEWESAVDERDHDVEAAYARAAQLIAAYRSGARRTHPRREEIPPLWPGEIAAMDPAAGTPAALAGRERMNRILREVEGRVEEWHAVVLPPELTPRGRHPQLPPPGTRPADQPEPGPNPPHDPPPDDRAEPGFPSGGGPFGGSRDDA